jgi:hypothetical protein
MNLSLDTRRSAILGIGLIVLGLVWWLSLWWLLLPGALMAGGAATYIQRRRIGRTAEAVQIGLWGIGLGLLFLIGFIFPGILFLAGASVLARGREIDIDDRIQRLAAGLRRSQSKARSSETTHVPVTVHPGVHSSLPAGDVLSTGETTRLRE